MRDILFEKSPKSLPLISVPVLPEVQCRLALRVGSVPIPRVIMQAVFPWRQGTPCGDMIASVTFSQPERLRHMGLKVYRGMVKLSMPYNLL